MLSTYVEKASRVEEGGREGGRRRLAFISYLQYSIRIKTESNQGMPH